jgi:hypothetical protein
MVEHLEINLHIYENLGIHKISSFLTKVPTSHNTERTISLINVEKMGYQHAQGKRPLFHSLYKY